MPVDLSSQHMLFLFLTYKRLLFTSKNKRTLLEVDDFPEVTFSSRIETSWGPD